MPLLPPQDIWKTALRGPRRYSAAAVTVTLALLLIVGGFSLQVLRHVQADQAIALIALDGTRSPLIASSQILGPANPQQVVSLSIGLRPRNEVEMDSYVQEMVQPGSPQYRQFLSAEAYSQQFSPDAETYSQLEQFLQNAGLTITHTYQHHLLIAFNGTIGQVEHTFHTTINMYKAPDGHTYYANATDPLFPLSLSGTVLSMLGLDNAAEGKYTLLPQQSRAISTQARFGTAACPAHAAGYYTPDQLASAYNMNRLYATHNQGEGQTVALLELADLTQSDVTAYTACFGHSHTPIQVIHAGLHHVRPDVGTFEATMDAELILGVAPQLARLKVYEAANNAADYIADWAQIVQDAPPIVSTSWGFCEALLPPAVIFQENALLKAATLRGETIIASSGDNGDAGCPVATSSRAAIADDPAGQPYVTSVGGTSLSLKPGTSAYGHENVWNSLPTKLTGFVKGGSGGGISQYWPRPAWQHAPGTDTTPFSHIALCKAPACRETPDVSLNTDPANGYLVYCTPAVAQCTSSDPWSVAAGTSASAPMWAGIVALMNELAYKQNGFNLGFINPLLYQIASSPAIYEASFHDITQGTVTYSGGSYSAAPGYDLATGLGSCKAYGLALSLAALERIQRHARPASITTH